MQRVFPSVASARPPLHCCCRFMLLMVLSSAQAGIVRMAHVVLVIWVRR